MSDRRLRTTSEVMDALGGTAAVARLTGRKMTAASNWRSFASFPSNTYLVFQTALKDAGFEAPDSLWGMSTSPAHKG